MTPKTQKALIDWIREERPFNYLWSEGELPPTDSLRQQIVMHHEEVVKFRNDYNALLHFAAHVCGVDPRNFCALDVIKFLLLEKP